MPPKKPAPTNKKDDKDDLNDPVPKNECQFKIQLEAKQEGGHYFKVKYEWISVQGDQIEFQKYDSGFFRDWTLIKIEGEEPKPVESTDAPQKGGAPGKKPAAAQAKPDPKKGGALEEITDNRPRQITFTKDFGLEMGGGIRINEEVAKRFADVQLRIDIVEVNRETQEETVRDTVYLDLSCLLYPSKPKEKVEFTWNFDMLKPMQLHYLQITINSDQPLLSDFLRKKLNPLQINLVACKDIPYKTEHKYKPVHCITKFVDEKQFKTLDFPQQSFCRFLHKHVFLVGLHDPVLFKEQLATKLVRVELHDCDEYVPPEDQKDAKFSIGCAKFTLKDFLRPNCKELKLRSDVFPVKREQQDNTQNLDLNTTARKNERAIEKSSPYLIHATYAVITAELSYPIGSFNEELELRFLKEKIEQEQEASKPPVDQKGSQLNKVQTQQQLQHQQHQLTSALSERQIGSQGSVRSLQDFNEQDAIFERAIIIIPYKAADTIKQIENSFEQINLKGLGVDNIRYLNTKEFSDEERKNRKIDFLGGFELIDNENRIYIIEGLGGEGRGINQFYLDNQRQRPNDKKYKLLYNPEVRYKNRLYIDFNVAIKKIKLRDTVTKIMASPDVYLRSKVPEDIYDTLQKFAEMRKLDRMTLVRDFNLFPLTERLLNLERKYGDSLSHEDLYGVAQKPKRKRVTDDNMSVGFDETQMQSVMSYQQNSQAFSASQYQEKKTVTFDETSKKQQEKSRRKGETVTKNNDFEENLKLRNEQQKDLKTINMEKLKSMSMGRTPKERMMIPEGVEVFMYGNQKLNIWEFQKEQLRKQIADDKKNFYTYSKDFLTLAFPLINENEIKMKEKEDNETKWKTKKGFDNLIKKNDYTVHPKKPPQCILDDLQIPYVEQLKEKMEVMKGRQPFKPEDGKSNFNLNIRGPKTFSEREFFNTVFISGDDMVKEQLELQQREQEEWKKKVVVENTHFTVNTRQPKKIAQVDKHKVLLEDPPKKIGLRLSQSKLKTVAERSIMATKAVENLPPSMFTYSEFVDPLKRVPKMKEKDVTRMTDGKDFNSNIKNDTLSYSPNSKKVFVQPLSANEKTGPQWYTQKDN